MDSSLNITLMAVKDDIGIYINTLPVQLTDYNYSS